MRSDILRVYKSLHTWTGIIAGMALFIAFYAGALTMFKHYLDEWASPAQEFLASVPNQDLDQLIRETIAQHPQAGKGFTLQLAQDTTPLQTTQPESTQQKIEQNVPISWVEKHPGSSAEQQWQATLDANGNLQAQTITPSNAAELIDLLHQTAGIPGVLGHEHVGVYFMGAISVLYGLALVSGLIILLPTLIKDFWALRVGKNRKRSWLDAHNIVGITSFPFHLIISLTAIVFAFHDQFYDGLKHLAYGERELFPRNPVQVDEAQALASVPDILSSIQTLAPDFKVEELEYMRLDQPSALIRVAGLSPRYMVRGAEHGYLIMHPYTGEVIQQGYLPGQQDTWSGIVTAFFALHFGNYGGTLMRWVYFALGLGGAFLFYTGNLLWLESRRKKLKRKQAHVTQSRTSYYLGAATVGICLGSVIGINISLASTKWLYTWVSDINHWHLLTYYVSFLACVIWSFVKGPAIASYQLLRLCALSTLSIPLTTVLIKSFNYAGGWTYNSSAAISVDITALFAAVILFGAAEVTKRRVTRGASDSVWSDSVELTKTKPLSAQHS